MENAPTTSSAFDQQFHALLNAWNTHHTNRRNGASVSELTASLAQLDANRLDAARISLAS